MHCPFWLSVLLLAIPLQVPPGAGNVDPKEKLSTDEQILRAAGLSTDGPSLLGFFHARAALDTDQDRVKGLARKLSNTADDVRARAAADLVAWGPLAVPVLRHTANDLADREAAVLARRCLAAIEGQGAADLPSAAARVLAQRKPEGAGEALLTYLPFADNPTVVEQVVNALALVAFPEGKADPAVLKALQDPVPLRRAAAAEALCRADRPEQVPAVRKLLRDPNPSVRLRAALALAKQQDAAAVPVLIDLLAELPAGPRGQAEEVLRELAGEWAPDLGHLKEDDISRRICRDSWAAWWRNTDGPALLAELRKRTLGPEQRKKVEDLVERLADRRFAVRERATADLVAFGHRAVPFLEVAAKAKDPERARRAADCLERIAQGEGKPLPLVAPRLLALRKPEGAAAALLDYLPWAEGEQVVQEVEKALLALAVRDGKPDPALLAGLEDRMAVRRGTAAEALARSGGKGTWPALHKLFKDPEPAVRMRVTLALAGAGDREAVPVLIDSLAALPQEYAARAEEALRLLAGDQMPEVTLGDDEAAHKKARDTWAAWWQMHGKEADLARLAPTRLGGVTLGYTILVEVQGGGNGRLREITRDGKVRWQFEGLQYPVDVQALPGNRVLVTEYNGMKVTERDFKGKVLWEKTGLPGRALNAQRLPNGNTFIATDASLLEVDRAGKVVFEQRIPNDTPLAACKTRSGDILCLTNGGFCVRLDARGKELKRFRSGRGPSWTTGIDPVAGGRVLVSQPDNNQVALFDREGKELLKVPAAGITTATWTPEGHVLAASYNQQKIQEIDRTGKVLWEFASDRNVFRARRR
jgi:HEAT repeat protein